MRMKKLVLIATGCQVVLSFFLTDANATYQLLITNRQYLNGGVQAALDPVADQIQTNFDTTMAAADQTGFLAQVGDANAGASRSYLAPGVYGEARYLFGFGISAALAGGTSFSAPANSLPAVGAAAQSGFNLAANGEIIHIFMGLDPKRVMYHASFNSMNLSSLIGHGVTLHSLQASAGVSYQMSNPFMWMPGILYNGVRLSTGASYGNFSGSYTTPYTLSSGGINMTTNATLAVDSSVFSVTGEATTGFRFFWLMDLYTGAAIDLNVGSTSLSGSTSNGAVSATQGGVTVFTGDAAVSGSGTSAAPVIADLRWLLGTQVNLGPLGIYAQLQVGSPSVYSLNLGGHLVF